MLIGQRLVAPDDLVQVCIHELRNFVHVVEISLRGRRLNVDQRDDLRAARAAAHMFRDREARTRGRGVEGGAREWEAVLHGSHGCCSGGGRVGDAGARCRG